LHYHSNVNVTLHYLVAKMVNLQSSAKKPLHCTTSAAARRLPAARGRAYPESPLERIPSGRAPRERPYPRRRCGSITIAFAKAKAEIYDYKQHRTVLKNDPRARLLLLPTAGLLTTVGAVVVGDLCGPLNWVRGVLAENPAEKVGHRCRRPLSFWRRVRWIVTESDARRRDHHVSSPVKF
jgi:hypothetical protein